MSGGSAQASVPPTTGLGGLGLMAIACLGGLALPGPSWGVGAEDLPQLTALEDRVVATIASPELYWSDNGACLSVAGRGAAGEPLVLSIPVDGRPATTLPGLVSPRMAFSPDGCRIACWQKGPAGPAGGETARLAVFDSRSGACTVLESMAPFPATSPLVWLKEPERIIALRQRGDYTVLAIFDPSTGQPAPLVATVAGVGTVLRPSAKPSAVIVGTTNPAGQPEYFLIDVLTGIASNVPPEEQAALLQAASPQGAGSAVSALGLMAQARDDGLWVGTVEQPAARLLLEWPAGTPLPAQAPAWSPSGERLAYVLAAAGGEQSQVHLVTLGLEELVCQIKYETDGHPPPIGTRVWVCMALQTAEGQPVEPEWKTLKAELTVTSSPIPAVDGVVVRARNAGLQSGVLKRLTGLSAPPADVEDDAVLTIGSTSGTPQTLLRSFTLPTRHGLIAWAEGWATGTVVGVTVTQRALTLIGAPAPR